MRDNQISSKFIYLGQPKAAPSALSSIANSQYPYPNPFNGIAYIPYLVPKENPVSIWIYDSAGQLVRKLDLGEQRPGSYLSPSTAATWDGRNDQGEQLVSGVYFYNLQVGESKETHKIIIQR